MSDTFTTHIPADELERFAKHLFRYSFDSIIIQEGQDNNAVFLLREGALAVEKMIGNKLTRISTIEAINIFGEMAMVVGVKRTATVRVISPQAIVYKFQFTDLKAIYANPAWSELLIARLCNDLVETHHREEAMKSENLRLAGDNAYLVSQCGLLFSALLSLEGDVAADLVMNSKAWKLLRGMRELTENFLKVNLPEIYGSIQADRKAAVRQMAKAKEFPDILKPLI